MDCHQLNESVMRGVCFPSPVLCMHVGPTRYFVYDNQWSLGVTSCHITDHYLVQHSVTFPYPKNAQLSFVGSQCPSARQK